MNEPIFHCFICNDGHENCRDCDICTYDIEEYPREPTFDEIETTIEYMLAESEAKADRM